MSIRDHAPRVFTCQICGRKSNGLCLLPTCVAARKTELEQEAKRLLRYALEDYRNAPSNVGPLAAQWIDKPHRLVYDLSTALEGIVRKVLSYVDQHGHPQTGDTAEHNVVVPIPADFVRALRAVVDLPIST